MDFTQIKWPQHHGVKAPKVTGISHPRFRLEAMSWFFVTQQNTNTQSTLQADTPSIVLEGFHINHSIHRDQRDIVTRRKVFAVNKNSYR